MRIAIYNQPSVKGVNGVEYSAVALAEALASDHEVVIVHHNAELTREQLDDYYGCDLTEVGLLCLPRSKLAQVRNPMRRHRMSEDLARSISDGCDLLVSFSGTTPPYCHAKRGVLMVIFPFRIWQKPARDLVHRATRPFYEHWERRRNLASYGVHTANSDFTASWVRRRWGVHCRTVYAPADIDFTPGTRVDRVLSVGRFATSGTCKNQRELAQVFRELSADALADWSFIAVGPVGDAPADRAYFAEVSRTCAEAGGEARADVERSELKALYQSCKLFWHAAGYGVDPSQDPDRLEHFGIVTVEAMAAGCVPIVIDRGGQSEIVQHGVSGFVWRTLDELKEFTRLLVDDDALRRTMSEAARERAEAFGKEAFVRRFLQASALSTLRRRGSSPTGVPLPREV